MVYNIIIIVIFVVTRISQLILLLSFLSGNVSLVKGGAYGPGEGQQLSTCNSGSSYYYYVYHVPVEECTSSPDVRKYCTRDRDVGVHCQPGQGMLPN